MVVGQAAANELSECEADHEKRQGQARECLRCPKCLRQERQGRRAHVDRQRRQRGVQAKKNGERKGSRGYPQRLVSPSMPAAVKR
jgi:hypothetical protein